MEAEIIRRGALDMQVCVPSAWSDDQVKEFADANNYCRTSSGWQIRRQGDGALGGCNERVPCEERPGFVHIMLDA